MYKKIKNDVHILLHPELGETKWDKILNGFIITLILLNVIAVIVETVRPIHDAYLDFFRIFDFTSVMIFSVEYILRLWSCTQDPRFRHPVFGRLKYIFSIESLIDLFAILPYYIHAMVGFDLRILRLMRLFRFLRLFRLTAYTKSAQIIRNVFVKRASELRLSLLLIVCLIIIASCLLYFAEHDAQPKVFSSIPASLWWSVVTVTSIGYGDMVPITVAGKILTGVVTLFGLALLALPAGIITTGFFEELRRVRGKAIHICPHCGKDIDVLDH